MGDIYIISGTLECGGRSYPAGSVAVRPPGMPHGPFHSATGCLSFEVRYRVGSGTRSTCIRTRRS
jgi:hypothetical protein